MQTHWIKTKDGRELPIRYSMNVGLKLATLNNIPMNKVAKWMNTPSEWVPEVPFQMHWIAIKEASRRENISFPESYDQFMDMLEDDPTLLEKITAIQTASQPEEEKKTSGQVGRKKQR